MEPALCQYFEAVDPEAVWMAAQIVQQSRINNTATGLTSGCGVNTASDLTHGSYRTYFTHHYRGYL